MDPDPNPGGPKTCGSGSRFGYIKKAELWILKIKMLKFCYKKEHFFIKNSNIFIPRHPKRTYKLQEKHPALK
jgi:hypothetical protein